MKCQALFSVENMRKKNKMSSAAVMISVLRAIKISVHL